MDPTSTRHRDETTSCVVLFFSLMVLSENVRSGEKGKCTENHVYNIYLAVCKQAAISFLCGELCEMLRKAERERLSVGIFMIILFKSSQVKVLRAREDLN